MASNPNTTATKTLHNLPFTTTFRLAFTYFGVVFSTGFLFGAIRQLYIVPAYHLPSSNAKIAEAPLMFIAIIVWANWLVNHYKIPVKATLRLKVGLLGMGVMACVEYMGSRFVGGRGPVEKSKHEEWARVARALYLFNLIVFGVSPWTVTLMVRGREKQKPH